MDNLLGRYHWHLRFPPETHACPDFNRAIGRTRHELNLLLVLSDGHFLWLQAPRALLHHVLRLDDDHGRDVAF